MCLPPCLDGVSLYKYLSLSLSLSLHPTLNYKWREWLKRLINMDRIIIGWREWSNFNGNKHVGRRRTRWNSRCWKAFRTEDKACKKLKEKYPGGEGRGQGEIVWSNMKKKMICYQTKFDTKPSLVVRNVSIRHRKNKSVVKSTARLHKASQQITFCMKRSSGGRTAQREE